MCKQIRQAVTAFVLALALLLALCPMLATPARADQAANGKYVIVIDPGHGGMDGGSDTGTKTEKEYNLALAKYIRNALQSDGRFEVYMTRSEDEYLKFLPRAMVAVENNADLVLSVHCNSHTNDIANGLMAYVSLIPEYNASDLGNRILDSISAVTGIGRGRCETRADTGDSLGVYYWNSERQWDMPGEDSLGMTSDYYSINTWCSKFGIPSIIVEHGYLTNADDLARLDDDATLQQMAWAEADAVIRYFTDHEHQWSAVQPDFPSNCTMNGTQSSRCSICGCKSGTSPLPAAPDTDESHYWRATASKAAACNEEGWIEYVCQVSYNLSDKGELYDPHTKKVTLPAKGHSFVTVEDTPAGHGTDGRLVERCELCGEEKVELRPGEPHSFLTSEPAPASCTEESGYSEICTICGETHTVITPRLAHRPDENGVCQMCGVNISGTYDESCKHQWEDYEIPPTCTEDGQTGRKCALCGVSEYTVIPASGHDFEVQMEVEPTCTEEGCRRVRCKICGEVEQEKFPPAGHTYITKEENGEEVSVCQVCGEAAPLTESSVRAAVEEKRRSLKTMLENPLIAAVFVVIGLQLAAVIVWLAVRHTRYRGSSRKKTARRVNPNADRARRR